MRHVSVFARNLAVSLCGVCAVVIAMHVAWADTTVHEISGLHDTARLPSAATGLAIFIATIFAFPATERGWSAYVMYKWSRLRRRVLMERYITQHDGHVATTLERIAKGYLIAFMHDRQFMMGRLKRRYEIIARVARERGLDVRPFARIIESASAAA